MRNDNIDVANATHNNDNNNNNQPKGEVVVVDGDFLQQWIFRMWLRACKYDNYVTTCDQVDRKFVQTSANVCE